MKGIILYHVAGLVLGLSVLAISIDPRIGRAAGEEVLPKLKLPEPAIDGRTSVEAAIHSRRSVRRYAKEPVSMADISQLLWAAQGITASSGFRSAPSAGALYPLEVDLVCGQVAGLETGVYRYDPGTHSLTRRMSGDKRSALCTASLSQSPVAEAPAVMVISAVYQRSMRKYGERGIRYAHTEAGHAAQNVCLQAVALKLGTVHIGAFQDGDVAKVLALGEEEKPLILLPIGKAAP